MTLANDLRLLSDAGAAESRAVVEAFHHIKIQMMNHATASGKRSYVFRLPHQYSLSFEQCEGLLNLLRNEGIKVTEHPNPDPGHPCSSAYTELSW